MNKFAFVAIMTSVFLLTACDDTKDVEYYTKHSDEAKSVVAQCKANGEDSQNCRNASDAITRNKTVTSMFAH